ncbi:UNVERIFIED_ORG: hypothetical protein BTE55_31160 [Rhizobium sophorae]
MTVVPCRPLCPAGHLPHRWGDWLGLLASQTTSDAAGRNGREAGRFGHLPISPPVGEVPGRAEGATTAPP